MAKALKERIRQKLISDYSSLFFKETVDKDEVEKIISRLIEERISRDRLKVGDDEKKKIIAELINDFVGFGPIEGLLKDPQITEIMINGPKNIFIERQGKTELSNITFDSEQQLMQVVYKILAPTRRHVDESTPYTEIALKDGSRVNIIIPPLALDGPVVTIRKFMKEIKSVDDLVNLNTLDRRMSDFLVASVRAKVNILFSGRTGSGKTTTVNVISSYIPDDERIVTIEDTAELCLSQRHVVRLEARQSNIEGKGEITIRELFRNSLRMRPSRIILGEIRGVEALDMLQAICSGHTGALSVLHADSPQDVIYRLEAMVLGSGLPFNLAAIHRQIASAIQLVIQHEQLPDGSRKITHITQINGIKDEQVMLEDLFSYEIEGLDAEGRVQGRWKATGALPVFYPKFKKAGIELPEGIFRKD